MNQFPSLEQLGNMSNEEFESYAQSILGQNKPTSTGYSLAPIAKPEGPNKDIGFIGGNLRKSMGSFGTMAGGALGMFGDLIGSDSIKEYGLGAAEGAQMYNQDINARMETPEVNPAQTYDKSGLWDAAKEVPQFVAEQGIQNLPLMIGTGGVTALAGRSATKAALAKVIAEKGLTQEAIAAAGKDGLTNLLGKEVVDQAVMRGTIESGLATSAQWGGLEAGGIYNEQKEKDPLAALGYGALAGSLEFLPEFALAQRTGLGRKILGAPALETAGPLRKILTPSQVMGHTTIDLLKQSGMEGAQEIGQTALERAGKDESLTSPSAMKEYALAGIAGAGIGGAMGGPLSLKDNISNYVANKPVVDTTTPTSVTTAPTQEDHVNASETFKNTIRTQLVEKGFTPEQIGTDIKFNSNLDKLFALTSSGKDVSEHIVNTVKGFIQRNSKAPVIAPVGAPQQTSDTLSNRLKAISRLAPEQGESPQAFGARLQALRKEAIDFFAKKSKPVEQVEGQSSAVKTFNMKPQSPAQNISPDAQILPTDSLNTKGIAEPTSEDFDYDNSNGFVSLNPADTRVTSFNIEASKASIQSRLDVANKVEGKDRNHNIRIAKERQDALNEALEANGKPKLTIVEDFIKQSSITEVKPALREKDVVAKLDSIMSDHSNKPDLSLLNDYKHNGTAVEKEAATRIIESKKYYDDSNDKDLDTKLEIDINKEFELKDGKYVRKPSASSMNYSFATESQLTEPTSPKHESTSDVAALWNNKDKVNPLVQYVKENKGNIPKGVKKEEATHYLVGQFIKSMQERIDAHISKQDPSNQEAIKRKFKKELQAVRKEASKHPAINESLKKTVYKEKAEKEFDEDESDTFEDESVKAKSKEIADNETDDDIDESVAPEFADEEKEEPIAEGLSDDSIDGDQDESDLLEGENDISTESGWQEHAKEAKSVSRGSKIIEQTQGYEAKESDDELDLKEATKQDKIQKKFVAAPIHGNSLNTDLQRTVIAIATAFPKTAILTGDTAYELYTNGLIPSVKKIQYEDESNIPDAVDSTTVVKVTDRDGNVHTVRVLGINQLMHMYDYGKVSLSKDSVEFTEPTESDREKSQKLIDINAKNIYEALRDKIDSVHQPFNVTSFIRSGVVKTSNWLSSIINNTVKERKAELPAILRQAFQYGDAQGSTFTKNIATSTKELSDLLGFGVSKEDFAERLNSLSEENQKKYDEMVKKGSSKEQLKTFKENRLKTQKKSVYSNILADDNIFDFVQDKTRTSLNTRPNALRELMYQLYQNETDPKFYLNTHQIKYIDGKGNHRTISVKDAFSREMSLMLDEISVLSKQDRDSAMEKVNSLLEDVPLSGVSILNMIKDDVLSTEVVDKAVFNFIQHAHRLMYEKPRLESVTPSKKGNNWVETYTKLPSFKEYHNYVSALLNVFEDKGLIDINQKDDYLDQMGPNNVTGYMSYIYNGLANSKEDISSGEKTNGTYINYKEQPWTQRLNDAFVHHTQGRFITPANYMQDTEEDFGGKRKDKDGKELQPNLSGDQSTVPVTHGDLETASERGEEVIFEANNVVHAYIEPKPTTNKTPDDYKAMAKQIVDNALKIQEALATGDYDAVLAAIPSFELPTELHIMDKQGRQYARQDMGRKTERYDIGTGGTEDRSAKGRVWHKTTNDKVFFGLDADGKIVIKAVPDKAGSDKEPTTYQLLKFLKDLGAKTGLLSEDNYNRITEILSGFQDKQNNARRKGDRTSYNFIGKIAKVEDDATVYMMSNDDRYNKGRGKEYPVSGLDFLINYANGKEILVKKARPLGDGGIGSYDIIRIRPTRSSLREVTYGKNDSVAKEIAGTIEVSYVDGKYDPSTKGKEYALKFNDESNVWGHGAWNKNKQAYDADKKAAIRLSENSMSKIQIVESIGGDISVSENFKLKSGVLALRKGYGWTRTNLMKEYGLKDGDEFITPMNIAYAYDLVRILDPELIDSLNVRLVDGKLEFGEGVDKGEGYKSLVGAVKGLNNAIAVSLIKEKVLGQQMVANIFNVNGSETSEKLKQDSFVGPQGEIKIANELLAYMYEQSYGDPILFANMVKQYRDSFAYKKIDKFADGTFATAVDAFAREYVLDEVNSTEEVGDSEEGLQYARKEGYKGFSTEGERNKFKLKFGVIKKVISTFMFHKVADGSEQSIAEAKKIINELMGVDTITVPAKSNVVNFSTMTSEEIRAWEAEALALVDKKEVSFTTEDVALASDLYNFYYNQEFGSTKLDTSEATIVDKHNQPVTVDNIFKPTSSNSAQTYVLQKTVDMLASRVGLTVKQKENLMQNSQHGEFKSGQAQGMFKDVAKLFGAELVVLNIPVENDSSIGGAYFVTKDNKRYIAINASRNRAMSSLVGHEVFHSVWDQLSEDEQQSLRETLKKMKGIKTTTEAYSRRMNLPSALDAQEEILADIFAEVLFTDDFQRKLIDHKNASVGNTIEKSIFKRIYVALGKTLESVIKTLGAYFKGQKAIVFETGMAISDMDMLINQMAVLSGEVISKNIVQEAEKIVYERREQVDNRASAEDSRSKPNTFENINNPIYTGVFVTRKSKGEVSVKGPKLQEALDKAKALREKMAEQAILKMGKNQSSPDTVWGKVIELWTAIKNSVLKYIRADYGVGKERIYADNMANKPAAFLDRIERTVLHKYHRQFAKMSNLDWLKFHDNFRAEVSEGVFPSMEQWQKDFLKDAKILSDAQYKKVVKYAPELSYNPEHHGMFLQFRAPDQIANTQNLDFLFANSDSSQLEGNKGWERARGSEYPSSRINNGATVDILNPYDVLKNYLLQTEKFVVTQEETQKAIENGDAYVLETGEEIRKGFAYLSDNATRIVSQITAMDFTTLDGKEKKATGYVLVDTEDENRVVSPKYPNREMAEQARLKHGANIKIKTIMKDIANKKVEVGRVVFKEGLARMLNNYLSVDHIRRNKFGRALLGVKNVTTALELAFSLFHFNAINEEFLSAVQGWGYRQGGATGAARENAVVNVFKTLPFMGAIAGDSAFKRARDLKTLFDLAIINPELLQTTEYKAKAEKLLGIQGIDVVDIVNAMYDSGLLRKQDSSLRINQQEIVYGKGFTESYMDIVNKAIVDANGKPAKLAAGSYAALTTAAKAGSDWLFESYIPNIKAAVFAWEYSQKIAANKDATPEQKHALAVETTQFVEMRFGEMNWNNLWMNASLKSALQLVFRSFTWQYGNWGALIGGLQDTSKFGWLMAKKAIGKHPAEVKLTDKGVWFISAMATHIITVITIQAVLGLFGVDDKDEKEKKSLMTRLMFPYIGNQERIKIPSYPTKFAEIFDKMHMAWMMKDPTYIAQLFTGGMSGFTNTISSLYNNKTFNNTYVYDPLESNVLKTGADIAKFLLMSHLVPMSGNSWLREKNSGNDPFASMFMAYAGVTKAGAGAMYTASERLAFGLGYKAPPTDDDKYQKRLDLKSAAEDYKRGDMTKLNALKAKGVISKMDMKKVKDLAKMDRLILESRNLPFEKYIRVQESLSEEDMNSAKGKEFRRMGIKKYHTILKSPNTDKTERAKAVMLARRIGYIT